MSCSWRWWSAPGKCRPSSARERCGEFPEDECLVFHLLQLQWEICYVWFKIKICVLRGQWDRRHHEASWWWWTQHSGLGKDGDMLVRWITRYLHRGESSSAKQQCILISSFRLTMNISNGDHALEDDNIDEILTVTLVIRHQVGKTLWATDHCCGEQLRRHSSSLEHITVIPYSYIGWQNLNPLSHPNATLAQKRPVVKNWTM